MTETREVLAARVTAGAAWLDERAPGWWLKVDTDTLAMDRPCGCVLGQTFKPLSFYDVVDGVGGHMVAGEYNGRDEADRLGFDAPNRDMTEYATLKELWTAEVLKRRGEVSFPSA